jgi:hypothetical protein
VPESRVATLTAVTIAPTTAEVAVGDALELRVSPAWSSPGTPPAVTVTWTRRGSAGGQIVPADADGRTGTYRAGNVGVDTLEAAVRVRGGEAVVGQAVVDARGPRVARVWFPARIAYLGVGGAFALPAAGRDAAGAPAGAALTYRSLDPAVATAAPDGTIAGLAEGAARVVAEASAGGAPGAAPPADTLRVVVAGDAALLPVALTDTVAQTGRPFTVVAPGFDVGAAVTLAGEAARVTAAAPGAPMTGVTVTPPAAAFASCRPLGATAPLTVAAGGRRRTVALPVYAPLVVALAPGQHQRVTAAAAAGCPVAVDQAGTYVAMPFAWDRRDWRVAAAPVGAPVPLVIATGPAPAGSPAALAASRHLRLVAHPLARAARGGMAPTLAPGAAGSRPDVIDFGADSPRRLPGAAARRARSATGAASRAGGNGPWPATWVGTLCPIPTAIGDSIPVGTERAADGRVLRPAITPAEFGDPAAPGRAEAWTLAALRPSIAVFVDSSLARATATLPGGAAAVHARLDAFADAYAASVAPLLSEYTPGVPRYDGTGRVIALVALRASASGLAMPAGYRRLDCRPEANGLATDVGAAFLLDGGALVRDDRALAGAVSVAAHEAAHLADLGPAQRVAGGVLRVDGEWAAEGYATLLQYLWALPPAERATAFTAERATPPVGTVRGATQGAFCERPDRAVLAATWDRFTGAGYPLACQAVRYALSQLAHRAPGLGASDVVRRWSALRERARYVDVLDGLLGGGPPATACTPTSTSPLPDRTQPTVCYYATPRDVPAAHAAERVGAFYLSWVADGTPGAAPELQDFSADVRALTRAWYPDLAVPAATLAAGQSLTATLGEPDALHVQVSLPAGGWVAVTSPSAAGSAAGTAGGLPTDQADVLVFRVR